MTSDHKQYRRKIRYIDFILQKRLLIALIVLEAVLLCAAGASLFFRLNSIVEENLYRIHFADQPPIFYVLLTEALWIVGGLVVANIAALLIADRIWSHYVSGIMSSLRRLLSRSLELDLGMDKEAPLEHKVVELALAWRETERSRHMVLRALARRAHAAADNAKVKECRASLAAMRKQLPASMADESGETAS